MTCQRMNDLVHAYLDDELSLTEQITFEQHLATCPDCEQAHRTFVKLRENLQTSDLRYELPRELRDKINQQVLPDSERNAAAERTAAGSRDARDSGTKTWRIGSPSRLLALAATIAIVLLGGTMLLLSRPSQTMLAQTLVDSHVRSLQANHLLDVVSTDQHTVKPWFDGKLDFAPPVRDLASDGFALIGGRLEYLRDHPAAALIYQRRKHIVNVFIWPESGADSWPNEIIRNGYNVVEWRQKGMHHAMVSDLSLEEMRTMVELLRK
jgi:anti-sigma factor RsiW